MESFQLLRVLCLYLIVPNKICAVSSANIEQKSEAISSPYTTRGYTPLVYATVPQWIKLNGFPVEYHYVNSSDGYVINLFRIPYGRRSNSTNNKKVVYLQHGDCADSSIWILNSVDKALAYRLADLGNVDVWLGNSRGSRYSLENSNLDINSKEYWNFSFHEIGDKDLPAIYDYIFTTTRQSDLYFISHSMGAAEFMISMSFHPEYKDRIRTFIGIAPAVFMGNVSNPILRFLSPIMKFDQIIHGGESIDGPMMPPQLLPLLAIAGDLCSPEVSQFICMQLLDSFFGLDPQGGNYDLVPEIVSHILSSTSKKASFHLMQFINSGQFEWYDYYEKNMDIYGQTRPPKYDLSSVTVPVVLFHGAHDNIVTPPDVLKLAANLPNVKEVKLLNWPKFNHIDFVFSPYINELMNDRIIEIVDKDLYYSKKFFKK